MSTNFFRPLTWLLIDLVLWFLLGDFIANEPGNIFLNTIGLLAALTFLFVFLADMFDLFRAGLPDRD